MPTCTGREVYAVTGDPTGAGAFNLTIDVSKVNDAPYFDAVESITVDATLLGDAGVVYRSDATDVWAASAGQDELEQTITFNITRLDSLGDAFFTSPPSILPNGTFTFSTSPFQHGNVSISIVLVDSLGGRSEDRTLWISIIRGNYAPSFSLLSPTLNIVEDEVTTRLVAVNISGGAPFDSQVAHEQLDGVHFEVELLSETATWGSNLLLSTPNVSASGRLSVSLSPGAHGNFSIRMRLLDGHGEASAWQTLNITVDPHNDPPNFPEIESITLDECPGPLPCTFTNSSFMTEAPSSGGGGEGDQTLSFTVTASDCRVPLSSGLTACSDLAAGSAAGQLLANGTWVTVDDSDGSIELTLEPGRNGRALLRLTLEDSAGATFYRQVYLVVNPVNGAPTFDISQRVECLERADGLASAYEWPDVAWGIDKGGWGEESQLLSFNLVQTSGQLGVIHYASISCEVIFPYHF